MESNYELLYSEREHVNKRQSYSDPIYPLQELAPPVINTLTQIERRERKGRGEGRANSADRTGCNRVKNRTTNLLKEKTCRNNQNTVRNRKLRPVFILLQEISYLLKYP